MGDDYYPMTLEEREAMITQRENTFVGLDHSN